jgi:hypothetical protein
MLIESGSAVQKSSRKASSESGIERNDRTPESHFEKVCGDISASLRGRFRYYLIPREFTLELIT